MTSNDSRNNTNLKNLKQTTKEKGKTIGTFIDNKLIARMDKIVDQHSFKSTAEFIRLAVRNECLKWEKVDMGQDIWRLFGGPLLAQLKSIMNTRTKELENEINDINNFIFSNKSDAKILVNQETDSGEYLKSQNKSTFGQPDIFDENTPEDDEDEDEKGDEEDDDEDYNQGDEIF